MHHLDAELQAELAGEPELNQLASALALSETSDFCVLTCSSTRQAKAALAVLATTVAQKLGQPYPMDVLTSGITVNRDTLLTNLLAPLLIAGREKNSVLVVVDATQADQQDASAWAVLFERMNEVRNTLMERLANTLLLILPSWLLRDFPGHAPDFWSIRSITATAYARPEKGLTFDSLSFDPSSSTKTKYRGLFFGVQDYQDPNIKNLAAPLADIEKLKTVLLEGYGFEDIECIENPTRRRINDELATLARTSGENENLLIYFAGHGTEDKILEEGYWLPTDAVLGDEGSFFPNSRLLKYLGHLPMRHILVLSDACLAGSIFQDTRDVDSPMEARFFEELHRRKSRWAWTSCDDTLARDRGKGAHSPLIEAMVDLLRRSERPFVTAKQLSMDVGNVVRNNYEQMPICARLERCDDGLGEFIFVRG